MKKILFSTLALFFISMATFAQLRIETPELVSPDDADTDQMPNVILDWTAELNATGYQVLVSADENFEMIVVDMITPLSGFQNSLLMFNSTYYWKVRAIDGEDYSDWTEAKSFTTFEMLDLKKPGNGSDEEAEVEFEWKDKLGGNKVTGFEYYQLQVDLSEEFNSENDMPVWNILFEEDGTYKHIVSQVYYGATLYWRMRAIHQHDTCEWSDVRSFETENQVELKKPSSGGTGLDVIIDLKWNKFDGTTEYEYQIHTNEMFNGAIMYFVDSVEVPFEHLHYGTTYYWHVRAKNVRDTTAWSEVWDLTTAENVLLASPLNMADSLELKPTLEWEQIKGTNSYHVEYSADSTFAMSDGLYKPTNDEETAPFYVINQDLEEGTKYFWRVRACAANDTSNFSEVWSFVTLGVVGIDEYFNTESVTLFPNPASELTTLQINALQATSIEYSLTDLKGQEIQSGVMNLTAGKNNLSLNVRGMAKGTYLVNLKSQQSSISKKLIVK